MTLAKNTVDTPKMRKHNMANNPQEFEEFTGEPDDLYLEIYNV